MSDTILRLREKSTGGMTKSVYQNLKHAVRETASQKSHQNLTRIEVEKGIKSAIKNGNDFPVGSGYTYDILLTPQNLNS